MLNANLLIEKYIEVEKVVEGKFNQKKLTIKEPNKVLTATSIIKLLSAIRYFKRINYNGHITIIFECSRISDDACINMIEICFYLYFSLGGSTIEVRFPLIDKLNFSYQYYKNSLLFNKKLYRNEYLMKYSQNVDITQNHYRRNVEVFNDTTVSKIMTDIDCFLKPFNINEKYSEMLIEVVVEIIDNALSHSNGGCILVMKVFDVTLNDVKLKLLNTNVINISDDFLGMKILDQIEAEQNNQSKKIVNKAYIEQSNHFNNQYDKESFCFISAFQKHVTTRKESKNNGGTGLTKLIEALIEESYDDYCYVLSGRNLLLFKKEFLHLNDDGTIGFNMSNNYYSEIPSDSVYYKKQEFFPGTLFNLTFVLER